MSKKGAALYNKIRAGGYGYQMTSEYSRDKESKLYLGTGSYTSKISSGRFRSNYVLKKNKKKGKKSKKATPSRPLKPCSSWKEYCSRNALRKFEPSIRKEAAVLKRSGKAEIIETYYSDQFRKKNPENFEAQLWVLPNLALKPKKDIVFHRISHFNLVNIGKFPLYISVSQIVDDPKTMTKEQKKRHGLHPMVHIQPGQNMIFYLDTETSLEFRSLDQAEFSIRRK